jgi:hypothetical protein
MNKLSLHIIVFSIPLLLTAPSANADTLQVTSSISAEELIQEILIGGGVSTSNITYTGANISRGKFWGGPGNIGVEEGVILTSGNVTIAPGPDNNEGAGVSTNNPGDPDLTAIAGVTTYDACVLEFDFIPQSHLVRFRYVFASEEYHEYVNQFNDAFGFFISGPGIEGPFTNNARNIALIPLSNTAVSINTVNNGPQNQGPCTNCQFFVANNQQFTQYDAFTTVLTAWSDVIPCETYHIKLAIGDGMDHAYDSGVFLEANSFTSVGIATDVEFSQEDYQEFAIEGCNNASVTFTLSQQAEEDYYLPITISGTAVNGVDYVEINDSVFFPQGYSMVDVDIIPIEDGATEWFENILLVYNSSLCGINLDTAKIQIKDYRELTIETTPDTIINCATSATIGVLGLGGYAPYHFYWSTGDTTEFITVSPLITTTYYITVSALCDSIATDSITVYVDGPESHAGEDQSIPYGTNTILEGSATQGSGDYAYSWEPAAMVSDPAIPDPQTVLLEQTTVFTLTVTDLAGNCQDVDQVVIFITGGPLATNPVANPPEICLGDASQLLSYASGGSENYSYQWISDPLGFYSDIANPVVEPLISTTYYLTLNDGFHIATGSVDVSVLPLPLPDAGTDDTIPHGTTTTLYGSATLGSGNYEWNWEPADKLVSSYLQNPITLKLYETTLFRLTVTDNVTGCESASEDLVTVVINGGPLGVDAAATDPLICNGGSTQLHALGYGGNFPNYTYSWSSEPPGFNSTEAEPLVTPEVSTTYYVSIFDGFNGAQGSVNVTVSQPPVFSLGNDILACPFDSVTISVDMPDVSYYWSNGSVDGSVTVGTTGIGFDIKELWLEVENEHGCSYTDTIRVIFDFSQCFGVAEHGRDIRLLIYPNPTTGILNLEGLGLSGDARISLLGLQGLEYFDRALAVDNDGNCRDRIDLQGMAPGLYLVRVLDRQGVTIRKITLR